MDKNSPIDAEVVDLKCPRCIGRGRSGLLARLVKRRLNLTVQSAVSLGNQEMVADVVFHCDKCNVDVVYMLALLPGVPVTSI